MIKVAFGLVFYFIILYTSGNVEHAVFAFIAAYAAGNLSDIARHVKELVECF